MNILYSVFNNIQKKLINMGDETYAERVVIVSSTGADAVPQSGGRVLVEPLRMVQDPLADIAITANIASTQAADLLGVPSISIMATAPCRFAIASASAPAVTASSGHLLLAGERIDIDLPVNPRLSVIQASGPGITTSTGVLNIIRLTA